MIDFSIWEQLLKQYVNEQGEVDYQRWQLEAKTDLEQWLNTLSNVSLPALSSSQRLAFWINLYNALVIAEVLKTYPINSIRPTFLGIPNWFTFLRFFSRPIYRLNNDAITLNDIEHQILRPQWQEPRIHFALVCAAVGCPLLRNEAYHPHRILEQLEADATRFINNVDKVQYDPQSNQLWCSSIFKWYQRDFLKVTSSIKTYIAKYLAFNIPESVSLKYLPYDWHLNDIGWR